MISSIFNPLLINPHPDVGDQAKKAAAVSRGKERAWRRLFSGISAFRMSKQEHVSFQLQFVSGSTVVVPQ